MISSFGKNRPQLTSKELRRKRLIICGMAIVIFIALHKYLTYRNYLIPIQLENIYDQSFYVDIDTVDNWRNLSQEQISQMSQLGQMVYLNPSLRPSIQAKHQNFSVVIWNYYEKNVTHPHLLRLVNEIKNDPLKNCPVQNCKITYDQQKATSANAMLFPLELLVSLPENRTKNQIWIIYFDDLPRHILQGKDEHFLKAYNGVFNWTMSYQLTSDVPVPFGRTILKKTGETLNFNDQMAATKLISTRTLQCQRRTRQWDYLQELNFYISIDIFGICGNITNECTDHYANCDSLRNYKFYLVFDHFNSIDYFSEDIWWNAYDKNLIPIIMGPSYEQCQQILPKSSFIHVDMFENPQRLYDYLSFLMRSQSVYSSYFRWRKYFSVVNEHGYDNSHFVQFCRLCEALNYNNNQDKTIWNLKQLLQNDNYF